MDSDVVVVLLQSKDFRKMTDPKMRSLFYINDLTNLSDSYFWDQEGWALFLEKLLSFNPKSIGVTLFFGDNIGKINLNEAEKKIFLNQKIFWTTSVNHLESTLLPAFTNRFQNNIGSTELRKDDDGMLRHLELPPKDQVHLIEAMTGLQLNRKSLTPLINYRGPSTVVEKISASEIINNKVPLQKLKNKIILIGAEDTQTEFLTPMGPLSRSEVLAQATDNLLKKRWIVRYSFAVYAVFLFFVAILAVFIITRFPQSVSFVFFWWIGTLIAAMSAWVFDTFYIWIPATSPIILLTTVWIIFVGYQISQVEQKNYVLEQEQKSHQELEQLKNNFVSLISHDLKTPIAKIQAVVDRMLTRDWSEEAKKDFQALRSYNDELNRYIQSILQVLRVESRDFKVYKEVADINEVIETALRQLRPLAQEKNILIETELEPIFSVEFDITLLKEVVINLVENAIKFSDSGSSINIKSWEDKNFVHVSVRDKGPGISAQELDTVWKKFTRGKGQELKTKGSGLGLYLVKYFIELHGGNVAMESEVGKGTTVSFTLPINDDTTIAEEAKI